MNIQEGNKIIAEFMGMVAQSTDVWADAKTGSIVIPGEYRPHKDWNELMPVVEKIKKSGFYYQITDWQCRFTRFNDYSGIVAEASKVDSKEPEITRVWSAIVDFITWYNTQQH